MSFLKRLFGHGKGEDLQALIKERERLATEVIPKLQEAIRKDPSEAILHSSLGKLLVIVGRLDEARAECQTALRLDPDLPDARELEKLLNL